MGGGRGIEEGGTLDHRLFVALIHAGPFFSSERLGSAPQAARASAGSLSMSRAPSQSADRARLAPPRPYPPCAMAHSTT